MSRRNEVEIAISLQDRMSNDLKRAWSNLQKFQSSVSKMALPLTVAAAAVTGTVLAIKGLTEAALVQKRAEDTLAQTIRNSGQQWGRYEDQIKTATAALQQKTNFGDEEQIQALSKMVAITGDVDKAMAALPAGLDAAALSGRDLNTVSETLTKALTGQTNTAESLGIQFDTTAGFQERLNVVMARAGGAAAANADPYTQLGNSVGDLEEGLGELLLAPALDFTNFLKDTVDLANQATDAVQKFNRRGLGEMEKRVQEIELDEANARLEELNKIVAEGEGTFNKVITAITPYGDSVNRASMRVNRAREEIKLLNERIKDLKAVTDTTTPAVRQLSTLQITLGQIWERSAQQVDAFTEAVAREREQIEGGNWENALAGVEAAFAGAAESDRAFIEGLRDPAQAEWSRNQNEAGVRLNALADELSQANVGLGDQSDKIEEANRIIGKWRQGLLIATKAEELLFPIMGEVTEELRAQIQAILDQNAAWEDRIKLQERLTGRQLLQPGGFTGTMGQVESVFGGFMQNALRRGGTAIEGGVDIGGRAITLDNFMDLVQQLGREGTRRGVSPLIDALRRLEDLAGFQHGGVVPGALGSPQLAMVHSGETILPTHKGGSMGAIVNVQINVAGSILSERELLQKVKRSIVDTVRGGGFRGVISRNP
jgi:hypothetical protein